MRFHSARLLRRSKKIRRAAATGWGHRSGERSARLKASSKTEPDFFLLTLPALSAIKNVYLCDRRRYIKCSLVRSCLCAIISFAVHTFLLYTYISRVREFSWCAPISDVRSKIRRSVELAKICGCEKKICEYFGSLFLPRLRITWEVVSNKLWVFETPTLPKFRNR